MKIYDNFLPTSTLETIQKVCSSELPWEFNTEKVYSFSDDNKNDALTNYAFTHMFYFRERSKYYNLVVPIMDKITEFSTLGAIRRIKANLEPYNSERIYSGFHTDYAVNPNDNREINLISRSLMNVGIFYVNTCDGYTEFEDGARIESVANRFIMFSNDIEHRGVSQTDSKYRIVINFNWFS